MACSSLSASGVSCLGLLALISRMLLAFDHESDGVAKELVIEAKGLTLTLEVPRLDSVDMYCVHQPVLMKFPLSVSAKSTACYRSSAGLVPKTSHVSLRKSLIRKN